MQFANHTCESNVLDQKTEGRSPRNPVQRAWSIGLLQASVLNKNNLHCLAYASLGRMGIVLYVAAATHAQAHRGTCAFADYMYQFIVSNAHRVTVLRPAKQQFWSDQS